MDWCFVILSVACAIFSVQIFMDHTRQTRALWPKIRHLEEEAKGRESEKEKYLKMADEIKARIGDLDGEIKQLDQARSRHEKALQDRFPEDGARPQDAPA